MIATGFSLEKVLAELRDTYLAGNAEDIELLQTTVVRSSKEVFAVSGDFPLAFTDHGHMHSTRVLWWALRIVDHLVNNGVPAFSSDEIMLLAAGAYMHDIGMGLPPLSSTNDHGVTLSQEQIRDRVRKEHPERVKDYLQENRQRFEILRKRNSLTYSHLSEVCIAHATSRHLKTVAELRRVEHPDVRLSIIAKILLLADEFELTEQRCDVDNVNFPALDPVSRAHWLRHNYIPYCNANLPTITLHFRFPGPLDQYKQFIDWTTLKLYEQIAMVCSDLPQSIARLFDFTIKHEVLDDRSDLRFECPADTLDIVMRDTVSLRHAVRKGRGIRSLVSAREKLNSVHEPRQQTKFAIRMHEILTVSFRSFWTPDSDNNLLPVAYVQVGENIELMNWCAKCIQDWAGTGAGPPPRLSTSRRVFILRGRTGVGKSSWLAYFFKHALAEEYPGYQNHVFAARVSPIASEHREGILRSLTADFVEQIKRYNSSHVNVHLSDRGILPDSTVLTGLDGDACIELMRQLILAIQGTQFGRGLIQYSDDQGADNEARSSRGDDCDSIGLPRLVVIAVDNIDQCTSDSVILDVFRTLSDLALKTGCVLLFPVRPDTYSLVQPIIDDRRPTSTIEVAPPPFTDVLKRRIEYAFSSKNPWYVEHKDRLVREWPGNIDIEFADLPKTIETACMLVAEEWEGQAFLSGFAGTNVRVGLQLISDIMTSPNLSNMELLELAQGSMRHPFRLVRHIMRGQHAVYSERTSSFINLFRPCSPRSGYFARINVLKLLQELCIEAGEDDGYVAMDSLIDLSDARFGYNADKVFLALSQVMARSGHYPLIENRDDRSGVTASALHASGLSETMTMRKLKLSDSGGYYLDHLLFQFNYVRTTMVDTPLEDALASRIARAEMGGAMSTVVEAVREYLSWLAEQERLEMSGDALWYWRGGLVPIVTKEIDKQIDQMFTKAARGR